MNVVIMGVQGSGKGTQAKRLAEEFGLTHINIGELFREEIAAATETGLHAEEYISRGELVPDDVTFEVIEHATRGIHENLVFDGFPRNQEQARHLLESFRIDSLVILKLSDSEAVKRISARRHCRVCKADYNLLYKPPEQKGICDLCGGELEMRTDDEPAKVKRRIEIYNTKARAIKDFLSGKVKIIHIDAARGIDEIFWEISKKLEAVKDK